MLPHPRFQENQLLYLTYSKACDKGATTALHRGRFDGKALTDGRDLFVADNCNTGNPHFGSKLAFGRDGLLYMTIGERGDRNRAQNTASHGGKILRLKDDGTVPPDNPFVGKAGYKPEIFSYGHRNPQGLAFHPDTGVLWENEHGPQGGDELNIVQAGKNYGWPVATLRPRVRAERRAGEHAAVEGGHRGADADLAAVDRHLRADFLHGRCVPAVERAFLRRRAVGAGSCTASPSTRRAGCSAARRCSTSAAAHPRRASGAGRQHLPGDRRQPRAACCASSP